MKEKLPEVIHVGFSKCASTFLQSYFENHEDIFLVNQSHFFSPFEMNTYNSGANFYSEYFENAVNDQVSIESDEHILMPLLHPVLFAAGSTLESIDKVSDMIVSITPNTKIIIIIRSQLSLIVSRYSEYLLGGGKLVFDDFISEFITCSTDGKNYFQNYYFEIIELFNKKFGKQNVLVLLQEELAKSGESNIQKICSFTGVAYMNPKKKNKGIQASRFGLSYNAMRIVRLYNKLVIKTQSRAFHQAETRIPYVLYKILLKGIRVIDYYMPKKVQGSKKKLVTPDIEKKFNITFGSDNVKLGQLLEKDMRSLGYPC